MAREGGHRGPSRELVRARSRPPEAPFELEARQLGKQLPGRDAQPLGEEVRAPGVLLLEKALEPLAERSVERPSVLPPLRRGRRRPGERNPELGEEIFGGERRDGAVLEKLQAAESLRLVDAAGDGVDALSLLQGPLDGDEAAGAHPRLDDQDQRREAAEQAVSLGEVEGARRRLEGELAEQGAAPARGDGLGQPPVLRRIDPPQAGAQDRERAAPCFQGRLLRGAVDAASEAADHGGAAAREAGGEAAGLPQPVGAGMARAHDAGGAAVLCGEAAAAEKDERHAVEVADRLGVACGAADEDGDPLALAAADLLLGVPGPAGSPQSRDEPRRDAGDSRVEELLRAAEDLLGAAGTGEEAEGEVSLMEGCEVQAKDRDQVGAHVRPFSVEAARRRVGRAGRSRIPGSAEVSSRWQERFGERGLVVLAVNGWDEPREQLAKYASEKSLKQRILLGGSEVAREKYAVRGYPTAFLIDREGRIAAREVGFAPAVARSREAKIEELVAGRLKAELKRGASR
jgi:hypothetical protein